MIENKRFYTTRHHHESGSYKMVHDKSERFSFPRATRDSDLFLHCMNTLAEENEELKEELTEQVNRKDACLKTAHSFNMKIKRLEKENEQLKQTMCEVIELLSEEVDLFSDKATKHDINAYMELKELDNKDAYYMILGIKKAIKMLKEIE